MIHTMLDLETWGTTPGSALRSIGLVQFDPRVAGFGREFYCNVEKQNQLDLGATIDPNTEKWWARQSKEAQGALEDNQISLKEACTLVRDYFKKAKVSHVWAQGSNFDPVLLEASFRLVDMTVPWRFYNTRDTRTVYNVASFDPKRITRKGEHHNALEDAKHQVRCVYMSYKILHGESK